MKKYGIKTNWGGRGTVIYVIRGLFKNKAEAYEAAKRDYAWFRLEPNISDIVECQ